VSLALWPAIEMMAAARSSLLERMRKAADAWTPPPLLAGLYGSAARGDGDEDSDIDLLVITVA
jgi:predicted nucleotidyltransferase